MNKILSSENVSDIWLLNPAGDLESARKFSNAIEEKIIANQAQMLRELCIKDEPAFMLALANRIAGNACPEEDSRIEIAYAIARHLKLGWPSAEYRESKLVTVAEEIIAKSVEAYRFLKESCEDLSHPEAQESIESFEYALKTMLAAARSE